MTRRNETLPSSQSDKHKFGFVLMLRDKAVLVEMDEQL